MDVKSSYLKRIAFRIVSYLTLNRFDEAKACAQALERKLHTPFINVVMYKLAFAQNDTGDGADGLRSRYPRCQR